MTTSRARIDDIRKDITENHWQCIEPFIGGRGGFGETFCGHIHELNLTFLEQADHYGITLDELADVTADHIRRLGDSMVGEDLTRYLLSSFNERIARKRLEFCEICQRDTSPPTTGEINTMREIQALVKERNEFSGRLYAGYQIEAAENID